MPVLGAIVDQQQYRAFAMRVGQQVEQRLRLLVDPVQVLEDHDQRLIQAFTHDDALDRVERALPS